MLSLKEEISAVTANWMRVERENPGYLWDDSDSICSLIRTNRKVGYVRCFRKILLFRSATSSDLCAVSVACMKDFDFLDVI